MPAESAEPTPAKLERLKRLEALSDSELEAVVRAGRHVHLPAQWALIWERTPADKAYLIVEGEGSVRHGKEEITRLGPGDIIGEMAIVRHRLRSASVVSLTPMEVIHFTSENLARLIEEVPAFGTAIQETTQDRLDDSMPLNG